MRALWRGAIAFGLVHIPVKVYAATEDRDVTFRQLHALCHTPVRYQKWCPTCEKVLESAEIVRGYEHARGRYVIVDDETLEGLVEGEEKTVDVLHFVDLHEIDPVFFERSYYLEPDAGGGRAYKLLQEALRQRQRVAISQVVLRNRPRLAAIRVGPEGILTLQTLHYPDEIRSPGELLASWADKVIDKAELDLALQLVDQRSVPFEPANYDDSYREAVLAHVEERLAEAPVQPPAAARAGRVVDLLEALKASLQQGNGDVRTKGNGDGRTLGAVEDHTRGDGKGRAKKASAARSPGNGVAAAAPGAMVNGDGRTASVEASTDGGKKTKARTKARNGATPR